jgi:hypothetical protein
MWRSTKEPWRANPIVPLPWRRCESVSRAAWRTAAGPARPFSPSIFLDKNRRDIGKSQSIWAGSKMKTAGSPIARPSAPASTCLELDDCSIENGEVCSVFRAAAVAATEGWNLPGRFRPRYFLTRTGVT